MMTLEKDIERLYDDRRPASIHLYLRPVVILLCFLAGLYAFKIVFIDEIKGVNDIDVYTAQNQMESGDFQKAEETLQQVLVKQPNYSAANRMLGFLYLQQDRLDESLAYYNKALLYSPDQEGIEKMILLVTERINNE